MKPNKKTIKYEKNITEENGIRIITETIHERINFNKTEYQSIFGYIPKFKEYKKEVKK